MQKKCIFECSKCKAKNYIKVNHDVKGCDRCDKPEEYNICDGSLIKFVCDCGYSNTFEKPWIGRSFYEEYMYHLHVNDLDDDDKDYSFNKNLNYRAMI